MVKEELINSFTDNELIVKALESDLARGSSKWYQLFLVIGRKILNEITASGFFMKLAKQVTLRTLHNVPKVKILNIGFGFGEAFAAYTGVELIRKSINEKCDAVAPLTREFIEKFNSEIETYREEIEEYRNSTAKDAPVLNLNFVNSKSPTCQNLALDFGESIVAFTKQQFQNDLVSINRYATNKAVWKLFEIGQVENDRYLRLMNIRAGTHYQLNKKQEHTTKLSNPDAKLSDAQIKQRNDRLDSDSTIVKAKQALTEDHPLTLGHLKVAADLAEFEKAVYIFNESGETVGTINDFYPGEPVILVACTDSEGKINHLEPRNLSYKQLDLYNSLDHYDSQNCSLNSLYVHLPENTRDKIGSVDCWREACSDQIVDQTSYKDIFRYQEELNQLSSDEVQTFGWLGPFVKGAVKVGNKLMSGTGKVVSQVGSKAGDLSKVNLPVKQQLSDKEYLKRVVQSATKHVDKHSPELPPAQRGTAIHKQSEKLSKRSQSLFNNRDHLKFEEPFERISPEGDVIRGRTDVIDHENKIVYDYKTGSSGMSKQQRLNYQTQYPDYSLTVIDKNGDFAKTYEPSAYDIISNSRPDFDSLAQQLTNDLLSFND